MAKAGLVVSGAVLLAVAIWMLSLTFHWFPLLLFLIGAGALVAGLVPSDALGTPPGDVSMVNEAGGTDPAQLRSALAALDQLKADGTITAAEHRRKRAALIDRWGPDGKV